MLAACRPAGLSALGAHYAGVKWRATNGPVRPVGLVRRLRAVSGPNAGDGAGPEGPTGDAIALTGL
jgi:hypothetical protein